MRAARSSTALISSTLVKSMGFSGDGAGAALTASMVATGLDPPVVEPGAREPATRRNAWLNFETKSMGRSLPSLIGIGVVRNLCGHRLRQNLWCGRVGWRQGLFALVVGYLFRCWCSYVYYGGAG